MKKALLVGINYKGTKSELNGCINDVNNMSTLLLSKGYHCKLLTDDSLDKPTKKNILTCWKWLLDGSTKEIFFHYSGHGSWIYDVNGDEKDKKDETLCPLDFETNGMITDDEIRELLVNKVPSDCRLVSLIDACHSETSFDLKYVYRPVTSIIHIFDTEKYTLQTQDYMETKGNVIMISGCKDTETSADIYVAGKNQGALTYSFLKVLTTRSTFSEIIKDINNYIKKNKLSTQNPCLSFGKTPSLDSLIF